jgi:hypothetical protein
MTARVRATWRPWGLVVGGDVCGLDGEGDVDSRPGVRRSLVSLCPRTAWVGVRAARTMSDMRSVIRRLRSDQRLLAARGHISLRRPASTRAGLRWSACVRLRPAACPPHQLHRSVGEAKVATSLQGRVASDGCLEGCGLATSVSDTTVHRGDRA